MSMLKDLNTSKLHYTKLPAINLIVLDFDILGYWHEGDVSMLSDNYKEILNTLRKTVRKTGEHNKWMK